MAVGQIGNTIGFAAVGPSNDLLATVTADGANTVTVDDIKKLKVGDVIDIVKISDGTVLASARTITAITSAGVVTYSGADVTASGIHGLYYTGTYTKSRSNINGGTAENRGFVLHNGRMIADMRARLTTIDSTFYSTHMLDVMTVNDMQYAIRMADAAASVR